MLEEIGQSGVGDPIPVIDANLSFTRRVDPSCLEDCEYEKIGDFDWLREVTGVDIGFSNNSTDIQRLIDSRIHVESSPTAYVVKNSFDLLRATREDRYGVLFYCQKHYPVQGDPGVVAEWHRQGLRTQQLAYSSADLPNQTADEQLAGGSDQPEVGVTNLGRAVIEELNRLNMVVDVSHCCPRSVFDAVRLSTAPITANHSNAYALTPHRRNKSDEELLAIAGRGGMIGVTPIRWMLNPEGTEDAGIDDYVRHVDYIADVVGIDHVGLATDARIDGWEPTSRHYCDEHLGAPDRWRRVARKLKAIRQADGSPKYNSTDLAKIFGGNFLRVFQQVLTGLTPPVPAAPKPVSDPPGVRFSWQPARAIETPTAKYDLRLAKLAGGELQTYKMVRDLSASQHVLALDEIPSGKVSWWQVAAHNEAGRVSSPWQRLELPESSSAPGV